MTVDKKIQEQLARLRTYVSENKMKTTQQRDRIAEVFFGMKDHLSAEQLLISVREVAPTVSLATVYRTLKLLTDAGLADARNFGDGQTRFEPAGDQEEHHDHLICITCGTMVEFVDDRIESLQHAVAKEHGFSIVNHKMELYGECHREECVSRSK